MRHKHLALYGQVALGRGFCEVCGGWALMVKGKMACCGATVELEVDSPVRRMSEPVQRRKALPTRIRRAILDEQGYKCFYCDRTLESYVEVRGRVRVLAIEWDHFVPWCYSQDNRISNYVAACRFCNQWKAARSFNSIEEVRVYVAGIWAGIEEENANRMRRMWQGANGYEKAPKVLQPELPNQELDQTASENLEGGNVSR